MVKVRNMLIAQRKTKPKTKGFTMTEAMVVVALIAVLAAIALPIFSASLERQRLRNAVELLVSDMRLARTSAESQGARGSSVVELTVDSGDSSVWSYTVTNDLNGTLLSRSSSDLTGEIAMQVSDFGDSDGDGKTDIVFTSVRGLDSDADGEISLMIGSTSAVVSRNLLGLISVCSNSSLGYASCGS